ncbi:response regulator [Flavitalea sp.]|nr:response regulator [Flavitalea sp.]
MSKNVGEILLVEDNMDDAALTIRALKKVNLADSVIHLEDGQEALDYLFGGKYTIKPKVIMLDIKMPRVDGIEVLRRVKADESTRAIPVVIMTSSSEEKDLIASYQLGVNSYVVKPVEFENFAKAVSELGMYWLLTNQIPKS